MQLINQQKQQDSLWECIQKMSVGERYAFRRNYSTGKIPSFILLYDLLILQKVYNEDSLKDKFEKSKVNKKFIYTKHILLQKICESNALFHIQFDNEMKVLQLLQIVDLLRLKGQISLANKYLTKAFQIVNQHEYNALLRLCLDETLKIELFNKSDSSLKEINQVIEKATIQFDSYKDIINIQLIYIQLISIRKQTNIVIGGTEIKALEVLKVKLNAIKIPKDNSFQFRNFYAMSQATLDFYEGMFVRSFSTLHAIIKEWQKDKIDLSTDVEYYFDALNLFIDLGILNNNLDIVLSVIQDPNHNRFSTDYSFNNFKMIEFRCLNRIYNKTAQFKKVKELINETIPNINQWVLYSNVEHRMLAFNSLGISCFVLKQYDDAMYYIKQNISSFTKATRKEVQSFAYLFVVLISYEQKHTGFFESNYNNAYANFYKYKNPLEFEKLILQLLKTTFDNRRTISSKRKMQAVLDYLISNNANPSQKVIFNFFNFPRWIKSKLDNIDYEDAVKAELKEITGDVPQSRTLETKSESH